MRALNCFSLALPTLKGNAHLPQPYPKELACADFNVMCSGLPTGSILLLPRSVSRRSAPSTPILIYIDYCISRRPCDTDLADDAGAQVVTAIAPDSSSNSVLPRVDISQFYVRECDGTPRSARHTLQKICSLESSSRECRKRT